MKKTDWIILTGCAAAALLVAGINSFTTPGELWFISPAFVLFWIILTVFLAGKGRFKAYSIAGSLSLCGFLAVLNLLYNPSCLWVLYCMAVLWWPVSVFAGRRAAGLMFAVVSSFAAAFYYILLNIFLSPAFPWAVFVVFALAWWPMTLYFVRKKHYKAFSVVGAAVSIIFFIVANVITTPHTIWAVYPVFAVLWWPLSMLCFGKDCMQPQQQHGF